MKGTTRHHVLGLAVLLPLALSGCATSPESLEDAVRDQPGVIDVEATENDADSHPGARVPKSVRVRVDSDASATEVMAVFDTLADDVHDGVVTAIEVVVDGPTQATLATGEHILATDLMVEELLDAHHDDAIVGYRREAYPTLPSVEITTTPEEFDRVAAVLDPYRARGEIDLVTVAAGDFHLIRDKINEDPGLTDAREEFVQTLDERFPLTGAEVSGRGPVVLFATSATVPALREYVVRSATAQLIGPVDVRAQD